MFQVDGVDSETVDILVWVDCTVIVESIVDKVAVDGAVDEVVVNEETGITGVNDDIFNVFSVNEIFFPITFYDCFSKGLLCEALFSSTEAIEDGFFSGIF